MSGKTENDDDATGETSYNDPKATKILPPNAYLRKKIVVPSTDALNETQRSALAAMTANASALANDDVKRAWLDQACLLRHLRARDWNVDEATTLLKTSISWRDERKVCTRCGVGRRA